MEPRAAWRSGGQIAGMKAMTARRRTDRRGTRPIAASMFYAAVPGASKLRSASRDHYGGDLSTLSCTRVSDCSLAESILSRAVAGTIQER